MRLHLFTLDEREAMRFRQAGWKFKRLEGSEWELTWTHKHWPSEDHRYNYNEPKLGPDDPRLQYPAESEARWAKAQKNTYKPIKPFPMED